MKKKTKKPVELKELYVFFHSPSELQTREAIKSLSKYPKDKYKFTFFPTGFCPYGKYFIVDPDEAYES